MTPSLRDAREAGLEVPRSSAGPAPGIEVGAPEVELATRTVLLRRDRSLGSKLPERVTVDTEVVRGVPRVEPLVLAVRLAGLEGSASGRKTFSYALGELIDQGVDE
jgi:hypothetical protein